MRPIEMRERADDGVILDRDAGTEHHEGLDHDIAAEFGIGRKKYRLGRRQRHPCLHCRLAEAPANAIKPPLHSPIARSAGLASSSSRMATSSPSATTSRP